MHVVECPGSNRNPHDPAASRLDDVAADDGVGGPVGPLDEHVRLQRCDQLMRRRLVENDDAIHAGERFENFGPLGLCA